MTKGDLIVPTNNWELVSKNNTIIDDRTISLVEGEHYYPDIVTVTTNNSNVIRNSFDKLGIFEMLQKTLKNGRPVWKHFQADQFLFYSNDDIWMISHNYSLDWGYIKSSSKKLYNIPKNGWDYFDYADTKVWIKDETLTVTEGGPSYPESIEIVSLSKNLTSNYQDLVGTYTISKYINRNTGKPVWFNQKSERYIVSEEIKSILAGPKSQWYIANRFYKNYDDFSSIDIYGWQYSSKNHVWPNISTLYIVDYPKTFILKSEGAVRDTFPEALGTYIMKYGQLENSRPRWSGFKGLKSPIMFLAYSPDSYWTIYQSPVVTKTKIISKRNGELTVPTNGNDWYIQLNNSTKLYDDTLTIIEGEPDYPEVVVFSSTERFIEDNYYYYMGVYKE